MPLLRQTSLTKKGSKDYRFGKGRSFISKKTIGPKVKTGTIAGNLNKRLKKIRRPKKKSNINEAVQMINRGKSVETVVEYLL